MRSPVDNPFVPGSDAVPSVWAGRALHLGDYADVVRARRSAGVYERGRAILGEPGIGKSVLVGRIAIAASQFGDLVLPTVRVPRGRDPIGLLAAAVEDAVTHQSFGERIATLATGLLDRIEEIRAGITVTLGKGGVGAPHARLTAALVTLGQILIEDDGDKVLLIHIDEVQNIADPDQLSALLITLGDTLAATTTVVDAAGNPHDRYLPIIVYLTGLWDFNDEAVRAAGATFARRFKPIRLPWLDDADIQTALAPFTTDGWPAVDDDGPVTVTMTAQAAQRIVQAVLGDPFLLQLVGGAAWDAAPGQPVITPDHVERGTRAVADEMTDHARRALDRLPQRERELLEALVSLPPDKRTLTGAGRTLNRTAAELGSYSARLEMRSIINRGRPITVTARPVEAYMAGQWP